MKFRCVDASDVLPRGPVLLVAHGALEEVLGEHDEGGPRLGDGVGDVVSDVAPHLEVLLVLQDGEALGPGFHIG